MPLGAPIPPSPAASQALLAAFAERGISWHPERLVRSLDPQRRMAILADGMEMPFDMFLGVPEHRVPAVVAESGMCVDEWIPVDPLTLETAYRDVYANGQFDGPSDLLLADKAEFGSSRIRRWFDRNWTSY
jgi:sulfide:quinone oxidoreductase